MNHEKLSRQEQDPDVLRIENFTLPEIDEWQDIDEVPEELVRIVQLATMADATASNIEEVNLRPVEIDEVNEKLQSWGDSQKVIVARSEGRIVGMISYYYGRDGVVFAESVAVLPDHQGQKIGSQLIDKMLQTISNESDATAVSTFAQRRVADIYARKWGGEIVPSNNSNLDMIKMSIQVPRD